MFKREGDSLLVPAVLADVPEMKAIALEDCPAGSLQDRALARGADRVKLYAPVVAALKKFHEAGLERALAADAARKGRADAEAVAATLADTAAAAVESSKGGEA